MLLTATTAADLKSAVFANKHFRIIRLSVLFSIIFCINVSAEGYSQRVTISENNVPLQKIFTAIESQTDYVFFYDYALLKNSRKVSVKANDKPFEDVLKECFQDQPLTFSILNKTIVIKPKVDENTITTLADNVAPPQLILITGNVRSALTGEPLADASIHVKSTGKGYTTDNKGAFKLTVEEGDVVTISYVGFIDKKVTLSKAGFYDVLLEVSDKSMNNVVVTGVFSRPKANYTGAASSFTAIDLAKAGNNNLFSALKSLDPSLQVPDNINFGSDPNKLPDVVLRSGNSLVDISQPKNTPFNYTNGVNTPLFIIDGFEVTLQRINDLDMNRIARVDILKDAAATAVYGSRAANGVIVIETIRPKDGKLRFTYNGSLSLEAPDLSTYNLLNATQKFDLENKVNVYKDPFNYINQQLAYYYNARLAAIKSGINTDWLAQPVQSGIGHKQNIYIEGGGNDALYGINLTYNKVTGAMKGSDRQNISGDTYLSYRIKNFQFRNDFTINSNVADNSPYGSFLQYSRLNPYWSPYDSSGQLNLYLEDVRDVTGKRLTNFDTYDNLDGQAPGRPTNPLYNANLNTVDKTSYTNISNNFSIQWQAKQWLRLTGRFAYQYQADESDQFLPAQHTSFVSIPTFQKGSYTKGYGKEKSLDGSLLADASKTFGKNLIFATAGVNATEQNYHTESFQVQGFPNPDLNQLVLGNSFPVGTKPTGFEGISRLIGFLSNLSYSYDNRFLADFSYRLDGSSQFGSDKRFAPFWSVGTGWNLHNEKIMKNITAINKLKLRYSFGYTGSQNFASYLGLTTSQYYTDQEYRGVIGTYLLGFGNSALAWQKTQKNNFGTDITLFKRLDIVGNYFIEKTQGSIASISTAPSTGFDSYSANMGDVVSRGWELNTRYNLIATAQQRDNWSIFANLFSVKNKIERVSNTIAKLNEAANNTLSSTPIVRYAAGQSTTAIWAVPSRGIDPSTGYEIFVKTDGSLTNVYDPRDQVIVGDTRAKLEGTFGSNFEKHGIGLNVYFRFRYGGQAYNQTLVDRVENVDVSLYNVDSRVAGQRWLKPGDHTFFKAIIDQSNRSITDPTYATSRFVQNDNSVSLENVSAYYRFSDKLNKRLNLQNTKITFYSSNVFYLSSVKRERGLDYPFARTFTLQLQTSF